MILLTRFCYDNNGTFGRITLPDETPIVTVERPWINNEPNISCIPIGTYECAPRHYNRGNYPAIEVTNVPGRSYILFHVGNFVSNSEGCILPNMYHRYEEQGIRGVSSQVAFDKFMTQFGGTHFELIIQNYPGGII